MTSLRLYYIIKKEKRRCACFLRRREKKGEKMNKIMGKRLVPLMIALFIALMSLMACSERKPGENNKEKMSEDNPLYALDEIRELNESLEAPFLFGMSESKVKNGGYEAIEGGIDNHIKTYRCKDAKDAIYTLGTRELHYGEPSEDTKLYVTALRILPASKTIQKNTDGSTKPVYTTTRSVLGIKVGDIITDARQKLIDRGYEVVFEEKFSGGLPKTLDNAYRKGAVMITLGAESGLGDISQIYVWIPYFEPEINRFNELCELPCDLGNMYSIMMNPEFKYVQNSKTNVTRTYGAEDGSIAVMRGFPDYRDMSMTAEVGFISEEYSVLGVKCGMSEAEAKSLLLAGGCTEDGSGYFIWGSVAAVRLTVENGTVTKITACLRPSTNLTNIEIKTN